MTAQGQATGRLSDAQRTALAARLRQGRPDAPAGIPRRAPGAEIPLSFGQEQLWFLDRFAPGEPTYNVAGGIRIRGDLDAAVLGRALDALAERHESLRTRLVANDEGLPRQLVDPPSPVELPLVDLTDLPVEDREERAASFAVEQALRPFDLATGPLARFHLVRLATDEHLLVLVVQHTIFDGWSFDRMLREIAALYEAGRTGEPAALPELPIQYGDYAIWERERLQGETLDKLADYWRENLAELETLQLPTDFPRPAIDSFDGLIERRAMGTAIYDGLRELSRREGTTLFVTMMAALHVLLHRYTGQTDIVVGTASANRTRPELAPLIGYLVNTLPIRSDLSDDPPFTEHLRRVKQTTTNGYAHQDLPFAKLVEVLNVERDASRAPVFQIGFTQANLEEDVKAADVTMRPEAVDMLPAKFDINFFAKLELDDIVVDASYATRLFTAESMQRLLAHFQTLLAGIVADPSRRVSQLPVLSPDQWRREVVEWNATAADYPVRSIPDAFGRQVAATPDAVAAEYEGAAISYRDLDAAANRIAHELRAHGVGTEILVGIAMSPSLQRLAALLGVLKAGGGYVPLDPELPDDRLAFMIADAAAPVVLADPAHRAKLPADSPATVLELAGIDAFADRPATAPADVTVAVDQLAYVIYTSGSTGRPKGVAVEHRHVMNFIHGMIDHWKIGPGSRVLQFASLSFDPSVMDIFMPLCSGGTVIAASPDTLHSPPRLAALLRESEVSFACLPPAVVNLLTGEDFPALEILLSAGEELPTELLKAWLRPGLRIYNGYGPTEATIGATFMELDGSVFPPPIGRPKPNYQAYVLDAHLNPVPVGVVGELHIGGAGIARGYHNRPELTAQKFIPDPFRETDEYGQPPRLYKTGDLARRLPDGLIQFLGRIDNQVKIHGQRVELGEIEAALLAHEDIAQAVVTVTEDAAGGGKHLIGYVRPHTGRPVRVPDLRQYLGHRLPAYMIPTHLMVLEQFPLTTSGKIDKRALPLPAPGDDDTDYAPPTTLIETVLVDVYGTILQVERVGLDDSFFDIGGNSLQAMQLVTRLRNDLGADLEVATIFLAPTPRQLTAVLRDEHGFEDSELGADDLAALADDPA